ncbi:protein transporter [Reticulomyxa filosa]|uniref:Protein transporter n=1 Tax=Reticulomyxa filosa TaxID=46433 RepID=X6M6R1_RETFI|nr:protein transporter [Reticulomyxa filosa]|eukprot:ETO09311.1 protein transporter [Reticulomyxa filosa]
MFSDENRREFQRGIDPQAGKIKRQEDRLNLRRQIREGHLNKRRKELTEKGEAIEDKSERYGPNSEAHYSSIPSIVNVFGAPVPSWVRIENLGEFASKILSQNLDSMLEGVEAVRQLLSIEEKPPILQVFKTGVVPYLIDILTKKIVFKDSTKKTPDELKKCKLQFEASW